MRLQERSSESGYSMAALLAMLAIMTLALMLAMPSWRYLVKDDREQELIFRGRQISDAIARFQRKNGNAFPSSLDQLVQGKYLRKAYADPLAEDGKWRILRPGETAIRPATGAVAPGRTPSPTPTPVPSSARSGLSSSGAGSTPGPVAGVVSLSSDTGLRIVNGSPAYNRWVFAPNVPFAIGGIGGGAPAGLLQPGGGRPGAPPAALPPRNGSRAPDAGTTRLSR